MEFTCSISEKQIGVTYNCRIQTALNFESNKRPGAPVTSETTNTCSINIMIGC